MLHIVLLLNRASRSKQVPRAQDLNLQSYPSHPPKDGCLQCTPQRRPVHLNLQNAKTGLLGTPDARAVGAAICSGRSSGPVRANLQNGLCRPTRGDDRKSVKPHFSTRTAATTTTTIPSTGRILLRGRGFDDVLSACVWDKSACYYNAEDDDWLTGSKLHKDCPRN